MFPVLKNLLIVRKTSKCGQLEKELEELFYKFVGVGAKTVIFVITL